MSLKRAVFLVVLMVGTGFAAGWMGRGLRQFVLEDKARCEKVAAEIRTAADDLEKSLDQSEKVLEDLASKHPASRFGFSYKWTDLPGGRYAVAIHGVYRGSSAEQAGLLPGDEIAGVNTDYASGPDQGKLAELSEDERSAVLDAKVTAIQEAFAKATESATVTVYRSGKARTVRLRRSVIGEELGDVSRKTLELFRSGDLASVRTDIATLRRDVDAAVSRRDEIAVIKCEQRLDPLFTKVNGTVQQFMAFYQSQFVPEPDLEVVRIQ